MTDDTLASDDTLATQTVASQLTGARTTLQQGASIGRYIVLGRLGAGGMGVVHAAWDPELNRKIALKLLRFDSGGTSSSEGRTRLLREAQAMARLSHPNVITVHDVGTLGEQVWVAMEFVDGRTLRDWLKERERSWREVLDALVRAGRGVAAAHVADLVHRDLKPDNVMVGNDTRVRVMDFGLARPVQAPTPEPTASGSDVLSVELTRTGAVLGTPAYMAPEQHRGESTDARTDQFSFCVMAWEALFGERPFTGETYATLANQVLSGAIRPAPRNSKIPAWIRRALERGLAREPAQRWPSMDALLAALTADPARKRRWLVAFGTLGLLVAAGAGVSRFDRHRTITSCEQAGAEIDALWPGSQQAAQSGLAASGVGFADETWTRTVPWLDRFAADWREVRTRTCMQAQLDHSLATEAYDNVVECLDRRRARFELLLGSLAEADAEMARRAVVAAASLGEPSQCETEAALRSIDDEDSYAIKGLRLELERARNLLSAGRFADGLAIAREVAQSAEQAEAWAVLAEASLLAGMLARSMDDFDQAELGLSRAFYLAGALDYDEVATDAAIELVETVGTRLSRYGEGQLWANVADMQLQRLDQGEGLRAARAANARAGLLDAQGKYDDARPLYERALAIQELLLGSNHPELVETLSSLALHHQRRRELELAEQLHERALALSEVTMGPNHPNVGASLLNLGVVAYDRGNLDQAEQLYTRALAVFEQAHGPDHLSVAAPLANLAGIYERRQQYEQALPLHTRVLGSYEKAFGPDHPQLTEALVNLAGVHHNMGHLDEARKLNERAVAVLEQAHGHEHPNLIFPLYNLGLLSETAGELEAALVFYGRSLALAETFLGADHPETGTRLLSVADVHRARQEYAQALPLAERAVGLFERDEYSAVNLAWARLVLAKVLAGQGGQQARAIELAQAASEGFRAAGEEQAAAEATQLLETLRGAK